MTPEIKAVTADNHIASLEVVERESKPVILTPQLMEIVPLLKSSSRDEIAKALSISRPAVDARIHTLYRKFYIKNAGKRSRQIDEQRFDDLLKAIQERKSLQKEKFEKPILTSRETEVLYLLSKSLKNKQIAKGLDIAVDTVKIHVSNILDALVAQDRTQAVLKAINKGILKLDDYTGEFDLNPYEELTDREKEVLADLANHKNTPGNKAIGKRLGGIAEQTVKHHLDNISEKTGLSSRTQKVLFYLACVKAGKVTEPAPILPLPT